MQYEQYRSVCDWLGVVCSFPTCSAKSLICFFSSSTYEDSLDVAFGLDSVLGLGM